jgi:tRNA(fMet)-specific endonuclease VapC
VGLIVDTSVFIEIERRDLSLAVLAPFIQQESQLGIASLTASELLVGVYLGAAQLQAARSEFVEDVFSSLPIYEFDLTSARVHAAIWAEMRRARLRIPRNDLVIAATALSRDLGILTHNMKDFDLVPGLRVVVIEPDAL